MAKETIWHGKNEEEIKKMELKEFMGHITSRQRRSLKKGSTEAQKILLKRVAAMKVRDSNLKTHCRDQVILPVMLGKVIKVYNGKEFVPVEVSIDMLGHRLGEFAPTRKSVTHSAAGIGATRSSKAISAR